MAGCGSARGQRPLPDRRISEADAPVWRWVPGAAGADRPRRQPWLEFRISRYAKWSHDKPQASPWKAAKPTGRQTTGQRACRERRKAAGKVLRVIDTWTTMTPAEIAEMREGLGNALLELELRQQDVARLEARNAYLESELKRVEQHHTIALKDNIVLKKQGGTAQAARAPG